MEYWNIGAIKAISSGRLPIFPSFHHSTIPTQKNVRRKETMAQQLADRRDLDFVLWEQLNCEQFLDHELYQDFNKKTCEMILTEARSLAIKEVLPTLAEGDQEAVQFDNGTVRVPESFHRVFDLILFRSHPGKRVEQSRCARRNGRAGRPRVYHQRCLRVSFCSQLVTGGLCHHG
jgi:hypothetical protein